MAAKINIFGIDCKELGTETFLLHFCIVCVTCYSPENEHYTLFLQRIMASCFRFGVEQGATFVKYYQPNV